MTYVISDIHGESDLYLSMINRIDLRDEDRLYVLGDVIDRGNHGIAILLDLMCRKNAVFLLGNHEHMSLPILRKAAGMPPMPPEPVAGLGVIEYATRETLAEFGKLTQEEKRAVVCYIERAPVRVKLELKDRKYHLSHTLPEFRPGTDPDRYSRTEFLWGEPDYERVYDGETVFVTGHTPTLFFGPECAGKIRKVNNHIAIDCGAAYGGALGCICLETEREYYVRQTPS